MGWWIFDKLQHQFYALFRRLTVLLVKQGVEDHLEQSHRSAIADRREIRVPDAVEDLWRADYLELVALA